MVGIVIVAHGGLAEELLRTTAMIVDVLENSPPLSVTMAEKVEWLRNWAKDRCVPAE